MAHGVVPERRAVREPAAARLPGRRCRHQGGFRIEWQIAGAGRLPADAEQGPGQGGAARCEVGGGGVQVLLADDDARLPGRTCAACTTERRTSSLRYVAVAPSVAATAPERSSPPSPASVP